MLYIANNPKLQCWHIKGNILKKIKLTTPSIYPWLKGEV